MAMHACMNVFAFSVFLQSLKNIGIGFNTNPFPIQILLKKIGVRETYTIMGAYIQKNTLRFSFEK